MFKNSTIWRSVHAAWELGCDRSMPAILQPDQNRKDQARQAFDELNPLYLLPLWGAIGGIFALLTGGILRYLLPPTGSAILFALLFTIAGEMRTTGRALALNVTFFENICGGRKFAAAREMRHASLKNITGLIALLLAIGILFGKFFCILLVARTGHYGVLSAALVIALGAEALMASEAPATGVPRYCSNARGEYIVALSGFLLLFNLIFLPLTTLIITALAAAVTFFAITLCIKRCNEINSDDMTMTGYLLEFTVWAAAAILIG